MYLLFCNTFVFQEINSFQFGSHLPFRNTWKAKKDRQVGKQNWLIGL